MLRGKRVSDIKTPWVIELRGASINPPLKLRLEENLVFGRADVGVSEQPDVDLTIYQAADFGVSRRHLRLSATKEQLTVTDLRSGNGTMINGAKLEPEKPYVLKHKDVLQLGRLPIEIGVLVSPTQGSVSRKQSELQLDDSLTPGSGQFVLIVEDDIEVGKVLALVLERVGFKTQVTHDVVSAMRIFNQREPAAIVLDLMLPDMNGLEFCRYVRRSVEHNSIPVVVVSASGVPEHITQALDAGADIFLGKPVSAGELRHVVSSLVNQHESGVVTLNTKHLVGTAPLKAVLPESRRDSVVLFVAGHADTPITLTIKHPITFGRGANLPDKTYIDLTRFNAIDYGVSRTHMLLHNKDDRFYVEDANSINGTYLNGNPLEPHRLVALNNADEIRLGQLRMYIYFLTDKEREEGFIG